MRAILLVVSLCMMTTAALAIPDGGITEPASWEGAGKTVENTIAAAQSGDWWYFSALVITAVMFLLKKLKILAKAGRWRYIILPGLSIIAALLAAFQGGASVNTAIGVLTASWATGSLQELVEHGILAKPRGTSG